LSTVDPSFHGHHDDAVSAADEIEQYSQKLARVQTVPYAEHKRSVLILLQALDAGGKDGTIRHVFTALNPQGVSVTAFKVPTQVELEHDFLWRVHQRAPGKGEIATFNRSHYEDVQVTRAHKSIDEATWRERYRLILAFERGLVESGTVVLKFFLHISPQEQLARFAQRLDDSTRTECVRDALASLGNSRGLYGLHFFSWACEHVFRQSGRGCDAAFMQRIWHAGHVDLPPPRTLEEPPRGVAQSPP
jgi:polyphosphate kinase 2 (PPK2 family)